MTARGRSFLLAALLFYLFANQTQVGWVYVLSALMAVLVGVAWVYSRGILRGAQAARSIEHGEWHEGDTLTITLRLQAANLPQLRVLETCPLADPESDLHALRLYVPLLRGSTDFAYSADLYRRGEVDFPAQTWQTRAPFGFFRRTRLVTASGISRMLVLPHVKPLTTLALLDRQPNATERNPRAGLGTEVMGVRDYRNGDSPRHIHWRSVARRGTLVSREFADESQPALMLVLDRSAPYDNLRHKHTPFEMAVKVAASVLDYALRRRMAAFISADSRDQSHPMAALTWDAAQQYLARVPALADTSLADHLARLPLQAMAFVVVSWPTAAIIEPLLALHARGIQLQVALIDAATFPIAAMDRPVPSVEALRSPLQARGILCSVVAHGMDWPDALC